MPHFRKSILIALILLLSSPASLASAAKPTPGVCNELRPLIKEVGLPTIFLKIAYRESRCEPKAVGWNYRRGYSAENCKPVPFKSYLQSCKKYIRSFDSGLWQVNSSWGSITKAICGKTPREGALLNARCNARVAKYLYDNGGLNHWKASSGS